MIQDILSPEDGQLNQHSADAGESRVSFVIDSEAVFIEKNLRKVFIPCA
jgi:hypothetical protein